MDELRAELAQRFTDTATAHHAAYIDTDGVDPEWPLWYADYLMDKLPAMLDNAGFTKAELIYLLITVDLEQRTLAPGANWRLYYADFFISRYL